MRRNVENVFIIAQKEFADCIWSPRFYLILGIFMAVLLINGYGSGRNLSSQGDFAGLSPLMYGFMSLSYTVSVFGALVAIGLGFDAIVKERKSGSLNVLLTHPVYRDLVITGKFAGMMVTLGLVTVISVVTSTGLMLNVSGITVSVEVINRIVVFMMLVFLFMLSYLALSVAISTFTKESSTSLFYNVAVWLILALLLPTIASVTAEIITGKSLSVSPDNPTKDTSYYEEVIKIRNDIMYISPSTHFNELLQGPSISTSAGMRGLFDTGFTLGYWAQQHWINLIALIVTPVILLLISYMAFMRQDVTL